MILTIIVFYDQIQVLHVTADGFSHMFALVGLMLGIPVLGSFHTDLMDLLGSVFFLLLLSDSYEMF